MEQYDIFLINLDPTIGHEIKKTRPCLLISPNEMNENIATVIIAPMTTKSHKYPTRVKISLNGTKGWVVLDQIRSIDKKRILKKIGKLNAKNIEEVKNIIREMLVE
ncbi:toxin-antitoxin system, toxin component, MazF family [Treponema primitia ZAS-2]|uniref:mRNA interferase n=2 Tax=Treponema primitia TaxID=88058 RepID=F5YGT2_TREPZ|nr:toxin-antitoxin system, toxin component, MazF family [Treponema primitia ZAS-2]